MAFACLNVLVNWDKWESYCFGRTALIQFSVKSVERVQLTFLGNTKWMKNAIHGKQSYCIFLFRFNWDILSISVLQFSSESNNFSRPPSLFCLQKIWFCWCLVQLVFFNASVMIQHIPALFAAWLFRWKGLIQVVKQEKMLVYTVFFSLPYSSGLRLGWELSVLTDGKAINYSFLGIQKCS